MARFLSWHMGHSSRGTFTSYALRACLRLSPLASEWEQCLYSSLINPAQGLAHGGSSLILPSQWTHDQRHTSLSSCTQRYITHLRISPPPMHCPSELSIIYTHQYTMEPPTSANDYSWHIQSSWTIVNSCFCWAWLSVWLCNTVSVWTYQWVLCECLLRLMCVSVPEQA